MVTNKNAQTMQAVQERTQAQKLVERQIELIRAADSVPTTTFCFTDDQGSDTATPAPTSSNDPCAFNGSGATSSDTSSALYHISISPTSNTYKVNATWDRLGGGKGNLTMYYYEEK
jgi:hypothetical protein